MDANVEVENFAENKVYEGIFNIFELELEEISRFVAFTSGNMNTYSNKIHELHLRVCSEIENVLKIVVHKHFVPKLEIDSLWEKEKSEKLEEKGLSDKYKELKETLLNNENSKRKKRESEKLDSNLFGFPDFLFYFKIACQKFNLHKKVIKFTGMVSHNIDWEIIQPFELEEGRDVPIWWSNYNKLKHDKIKNFNICTLADLIHSMSGLYILMTYLLKYQENNKPIQNRNFALEQLKGLIVGTDCEFCCFGSKFFIASNSCQTIDFSIILPNSILEDDFQNVTILDLERQTRKLKNLEQIESCKLKDINLSSFEFVVEWVDLEGKSDKFNNIEHSLFYIYSDYEKFVDLKNNPFRKLHQFGKFIN